MASCEMPRNDEYGMPYMRIYFSTTVIACALLIAFGVNFVLPRYAHAIVPVAEPCVPLLSWRCTEKTILNPIVTGAAKILIKQIRNSIVRWIRTGDLEIKKPFFITSFITDPQRIADNAARLFLSELTGINFCNYHPNIPSVQNLVFNIDLDFELTCDPNLGSNQRFGNGLGGYLASSHPSANFSTVINKVGDKMEDSVRRAISSFAEEARVNSGFLGQRDPKTGKVNTPGKIIADSLITTDLSEQIGIELVDEFHEAVIQIIDAAVGTIIQKGLSQ